MSTPMDKLSGQTQLAVEEGRGTFSLLRDAFDAENITFSTEDTSLEFGRRFMGLDKDPTYKLEPNHIFELAEEYDIPRTGEQFTRFAESLEVANSAVHAKDLAGRYQRSVARDERLGDLGAFGEFGLRGLAAVADPALLVPGVGYAAWANRGARLARIARGAMVGASEATIQEATTSLNQTTKDHRDVVLAAAFGLTLGGALGSFGRSNPNADTVDAVRRMDAEITVGTDTLVDSVGAARASFLQEPLVEDTTVLGAAVRHAGGEVPVAKDPLGTRSARKFKVLADNLGRMTTSTVAKIRALGAALAPEHLGFKGSTFAQGITATERQHQVDVQFRGPVKQEMVSQFHKWAKRRGLNVWQRKFAPGRAADEFMEQASAYHRGAISDIDVDPEVKAVVTVGRKSFKDILEKGQRAGVFSKDIDPDDFYLPRVFDELKVQKFRQTHGDASMQKLVRQAILNEQQGISVTVADLLAKGYTRSVTRRSYGISESMVHGLPLEDLEELRRVLDDVTDGNGTSVFDEGDIDTILAGVAKRNETKSTIPNAKKRIKLDDNASIDTPSGTVKFSDLLDSNYDSLLDRYGRRVSGAIALKETIGISGTPSELRRLQDEIRSEMADNGITDPADVDSMIATSMAITRSIAGMPLDESAGIFSGHPLGFGSRLTKGIREFNFAVFMPQAGFASVAEFGMVGQVGGLKLLTQSIPMFKSLMRNIETGKVSDDLVSFFEEQIGIGADNLLHPHFSRYEDFSTLDVDPRKLSRVERGLKASQRVVAEYVSGLGPMTRFQRRLVSMGMMKRLEDYGLKGAELKPNELERLRDVGITPRDLRTISAKMQQHKITLQSGYRDRSFDRTNLDAWAADDPQSFGKMMLAIQRESSRAVIEGSVADAPLWTLSPLGRLGTQFMTFALNAHTKLFLRGVAKHDADTAMMFLYSSMFAAVALGIQTNLNTIGRPEARKKAFEDPMSPGGFMMKVLARSGQSALIPAATDMLTSTVLDQPFFGAKTTGLPTGSITSVPTLQTADNIVQSLGTIGNLRSDRQFNREQFRSMTSLLPIFSRMIGVRAVIDGIADDLPASRTQGEP